MLEKDGVKQKDIPERMKIYHPFAQQKFLEQMQKFRGNKATSKKPSLAQRSKQSMSPDATAKQSCITPKFFLPASRSPQTAIISADASSEWMKFAAIDCLDFPLSKSSFLLEILKAHSDQVNQ